MSMRKPVAPWRTDPREHPGQRLDGGPVRRTPWRDPKYTVATAKRTRRSFAHDGAGVGTYRME